MSGYSYSDAEYSEENNYAFEHVYRLYTTALAKDITFQKERYKWVIGTRTVYEIMPHPEYVRQNYDEYATLFGITVERDNVNPDNVQLWKNITDEL